jgi:glycosyltransferase involved in cell wall biosynthesis
MKSKLRVAVIGTTGLPARYGGFETLTHHLVDQLGDEMDFTVYCSNKYFAKSTSRLSVFNGAKLVYLPLNANGYQSIFYDMISILHAVRKSDVLLVLGVSGAMLLPFVKLFSNKKILVNIDGQEWKRPKWNWLAKKILGFSENVAVRFADVVISDNIVIQKYVQLSYGRSDVNLIEYGGDHVSKQPLSSAHLEQFPFLNEPYAFNVSRIEPENNIHLILDAFSKAPQQKLVMVGLWNHGKYGMDLRAKYSNFSNIHLLDPIYNQDQLNALRSNANFYVHGHSAGGTNPSLVEAMCLGLPILSYGIDYNRETTNHRARYFNNAEELLKQLPFFTSRDLSHMGAELQQYGLQKYAWQRIASLYASAFKGESYAVAELASKLSNQQVQTVELNTTNSKSIAA